jgi:hercynylcysteine S-oxide lyase
LAPAQIRKALDDGVRVVDARSVDDFAAGHLWARSTSARPKAAGLQVDSAACSRQSFAVIDAAAQHARHEAEVGGYVAAEAAAPVLDAGRAAVAALIGTNGSDVVFTTGSTHALDLLLGSWPGGCTVACLPGEYGPNLAIMAAHGFDVRALPADGDGRLVVDEAAAVLSADPPALVHLTALASHRGVVQPAAAIAEVCRGLGVPLVIDAAVTRPHRLCGGRRCDLLVLAQVDGRPARRRCPRDPARAGAAAATAAAAAGLGSAVDRVAAAGERRGQCRCARGVFGRARRTSGSRPGSDPRGWRVVEPVGEPTAITTLTPLDGADPQKVRSWLIAERGIVTTCAEVQRAPFELHAPVLRVSPHVDSATEDLEAFAEALAEATELLS